MTPAKDGLHEEYLLIVKELELCTQRRAKMREALANLVIVCEASKDEEVREEAAFARKVLEATHSHMKGGSR